MLLGKNTLLNLLYIIARLLRKMKSENLNLYQAPAIASTHSSEKVKRQ